MVEGLIKASYRVKKLDIYRAIDTPQEKLPMIDGLQIDYSCFYQQRRRKTLRCSLRRT